MKLIKTSDESITLYNKNFNQCYHNIKDGALNESQQKYINPTFNIFENLNNINNFNILDICFGLGYNTFSTILYLYKHNISKNITIYSPEIDKKLVNSLKNFPYPKDFYQIPNFSTILNELSTNYIYQDKQTKIIIKIQDARKYIQNLIEQNIKIDVIYQDAFSSDVNHTLWTVEYFNQLAKLSHNKTIICTYSIATPVRLGMYLAGYKIYSFLYNNHKKMTIASKNKLLINNLKEIDMDKKIQNSSNPYALRDNL